MVFHFVWGIGSWRFDIQLLAYSTVVAERDQRARGRDMLDTVNMRVDGQLKGVEIGVLGAANHGQ